MTQPAGISGSGKPLLQGAALFLILAAAAALRLAGNRHGLPWIEEPDIDTVRLAYKLAHGIAPWDRILRPTRYPHLLLYLYAVLFKSFPGVSYVWIARIVSGVLGTGTVFLLYRCAGLAAGRRAALFAGALGAVAFLPVQHAHLGKPHVPVTFFVTASLYFSMRAAADGRLRSFAAAALMGGMAVAVLPSGFLFLGGFVTALLLAPRAVEARSFRRRFGPPLLVLGCSLAVFITAGYPNRITALISILRGEAPWSLLAKPHGLRAMESLGWAGIGRTFRWFVEYAPWVSVLGFLAFAVGGLRRAAWWRAVLPGFAMVFLYLVVFGHARASGPRFFLPILPPLIVAAAAVVTSAVDRLRPRARGWALGAAFVILVGPGTYVSGKLAVLYGMEDTRSVAARWIETHVSPDTPLAAVPFLDFPLPMDRASMEDHAKVLKNLPRWEEDTLRAMRRGEIPGVGGGRYRVYFPFKGRWSLPLRERRAYLARRGVRYGISVFYDPRQFQDPGFNVFPSLGKVVFRVRPGKEGWTGGELYRIEYPYLRIHWIERPGPLVEVVHFVNPGK